MTNCPLLTSKDNWIGSLKNSVLSRCAKKGSPYFLRHRDGRTTTVPSIKDGIWPAIIREICGNRTGPRKYQEELEKI